MKNKVYSQEQVIAYLNQYYDPAFTIIGRQFYYSEYKEDYLSVSLNKKKTKIEVLTANYPI